MSTTTPNYGFILPTPNSPIDANTWGVLLNAGNFTPVDTYLKTTALSNISNTAPTIPAGAPLAGQAWIDTNSSSTTAWYTKVYDGAQWVTTGTINPTTHTFTASGVGSSGAVNIVTFTSTGTYTPSSGMTKCVIECWGAGGGGGASSSTSYGRGGGAGGYSQSLATAASIGSSQTVTIGTGGIGVITSAGTNGGNTSVGTLCVANGGQGGQQTSIAGANSAANGGSTTGAVGNILTLQGAFGGIPSIAFSGSGSWYLTSGAGGFTTVGSCKTIFTDSTGIGYNGSNAIGYGAGGGGTAFVQGTGLTGGNGAGGLVRITEYFG